LELVLFPRFDVAFGPGYAQFSEADWGREFTFFDSAIDGRAVKRGFVDDVGYLKQPPWCFTCGRGVGFSHMLAVLHQGFGTEKFEGGADYSAASLVLCSSGATPEGS
jgi:hypothetical protein